MCHYITMWWRTLRDSLPADLFECSNYCKADHRNRVSILYCIAFIVDCWLKFKNKFTQNVCGTHWTQLTSKLTPLSSSTCSSLRVMLKMNSTPVIVVNFYTSLKHSHCPIDRHRSVIEGLQLQARKHHRYIVQLMWAKKKCVWSKRTSEILWGCNSLLSTLAICNFLSPRSERSANSAAPAKSFSWGFKSCCRILCIPSHTYLYMKAYIY